MQDYIETDYMNSSTSFPQKLYALLDMDRVGLIQWAPHGRCFRINNIDRFAIEVIPKYFKQSKMTSFQRQLNLYGFRRISRGEDAGCYFHPFFQRDKKHLLSNIKRLPPKGSLPSYEQFKAMNYNYAAPASTSRSNMNTDYDMSSYSSNDYQRPKRSYTKRKHHVMQDQDDSSQYEDEYQYHQPQKQQPQVQQLQLQQQQYKESPKKPKYSLILSDTTDDCRDSLSEEEQDFGDLFLFNENYNYNNVPIITNESMFTPQNEGCETPTFINDNDFDFLEFFENFDFDLVDQKQQS